MAEEGRKVDESLSEGSDVFSAELEKQLKNLGDHVERLSR